MRNTGSQEMQHELDLEADPVVGSHTLDSSPVLRVKPLVLILRRRHGTVGPQ